MNKFIFLVNKLQLEEAQSIINDYINVFTKREQEAKKNEDAKKAKKEEKKKKQKLAEEDMVYDEYADYEDKYY